MGNNSFATFLFGVRTPRIACLINENQSDWQTTCLKIIEVFSQFWGGAHFIIVPTDGKNISRVFWTILQSYDPDYLWCYGENYSSIDKKLHEQLLLRLAPFHYGNFVEEPAIQVYINENSSPGYPYTDLLTILPNCKNPFNLTEPSNLDGVLSLWAASEFGRTTETYRKSLNAIGFNHSFIDGRERILELFESVVTRAPLVPEEVLTPNQLSLTQLTLYRDVRFNYREEATLMVVGETLLDFCLYFCLSRMRNKVVWFLPQWAADKNDNSLTFWVSDNILAYFARSLRNITGIQRDKIYLLSASQSNTQLDDIRDLFRKSYFEFNVQGSFLQDSKNPPNNDLDYEVKLNASIQFSLRYPLRAYERANIDVPVTYQLENAQTVAMVETPKPKNFSYIVPYHHRWITEFSVMNYKAPRHPELGDTMVRGMTQGRITKTGIAYFSPSQHYFGGEVDQIIIRPKIFLPQAFDVFNKLFSQIGYQVQISDKGRFSLDVLLKFGSLASLGSFLLSDSQRRVLEKFRDEKGSSKAENEGIFLQSDRRRYLDFKAMNEILGNDKDTANLIDDLIAKSVFHRGLILKCEFCRSADWFNISELSKEFSCKRCGRKQVYRQFNFLSSSEPVWYYKLDEIVFKALVNDFIVPTLALYRLQDKSEIFDFAPELELHDSNGQKMEIDLCCIVDGQLLIGEAKKADRLAPTPSQESKNINKYWNLAEKLGSSKILFVTYAESWRDVTSEMIRERFSKSLTELVLWSKKDLFGKLT